LPDTFKACGKEWLEITWFPPSPRNELKEKEALCQMAGKGKRTFAHYRGMSCTPVGL